MIETFYFLGAVISYIFNIRAHNRVKYYKNRLNLYKQLVRIV
jgi:hypothetical protein